MPRSIWSGTISFGLVSIPVCMKYSDTYTDKLLDVIKRKQKSETATVEKPEAGEEEAPDLMEALRASIEAHSSPARKSSSRRSPRRTSSGRRSSRSRSRR